ncbi:MAG: YhcH/YjgK/YiaL family protein [Chloroflexota bacterium]|nr:YhcH/YjgK/YiaL family protein [Anaerolineae bacterium]
MIVTDIDHAEEQMPATSGLRQAVDFLRDVHGQELAEGKIKIRGDTLFALVQTYDTVVDDEWLFEGHRRYIDIQYIVEGDEIIGWAPAGRAAITAEYDDTTDAWRGTVCRDEITSLRLSSGQLAVFYPSDAHAPKRAAGAQARVRKIVVKVAVEQ